MDDQTFNCSSFYDYASKEKETTNSRLADLCEIFSRILNELVGNSERYVVSSNSNLERTRVLESNINLLNNTLNYCCNGGFNEATYGNESRTSEWADRFLARTYFFQTFLGITFFFIVFALIIELFNRRFGKRSSVLEMFPSTRPRQARDVENASLNEEDYGGPGYRI